jgi:hypothetical protein
MMKNPCRNFSVRVLATLVACALTAESSSTMAASTITTLVGEAQPTAAWGPVQIARVHSAPASASGPVQIARVHSAPASASGPGATSPNYRLDLSQIALHADELDAVLDAAGYAALTFQSIPGQTYEVDTTNALPSNPSIEQVGSFYDSQTPRSLPGLNPTIAASAFSLEGASLPAVRTLIIANASSEVTSYQVFRITFNLPFGRSRA